jgi:hypothetical protein
VIDQDLASGRFEPDFSVVKFKNDSPPPQRLG